VPPEAVPFLCDFACASDPLPPGVPESVRLRQPPAP
jgi:hypothetical protein